MNKLSHRQQSALSASTVGLFIGAFVVFLAHEGGKLWHTLLTAMGWILPILPCLFLLFLGMGAVLGIDFLLDEEE